MDRLEASTVRITGTLFHFKTHHFVFLVFKCSHCAQGVILTYIDSASFFILKYVTPKRPVLEENKYIIFELYYIIQSILLNSNSLYVI